jgi:hypothetical protein
MMRSLLVPALTALALIGVADRLLASRAARHFLPEQKLEAAVAAGSGCILLLGDSRMDAAYSPSDLHNGLDRTGFDGCVADLSVGATDVSGAYLAAREYLARGGRPRLVVVGKVADSLIDPDSRLDPQQMIGNNAIHLLWSRPSDVVLEVPGFPAASIEAFDAGFRFMVGRATAIGRYQSLFWVRVQRAQDRFLTGPEPTVNRFGQISDMSRLEENLRTKALSRMGHAMTASTERELGTWFTRLDQLFQDARIPFAIVELPMPERYRRLVTRTPQAVAYQRWLTERLVLSGGTSIDLGEPTWIDDALFADALHLNPEGAKRLSRDLGERLATLSTPEASTNLEKIRSPK